MFFLFFIHTTQNRGKIYPVKIIKKFFKYRIFLFTLCQTKIIRRCPYYYVHNNFALTHHRVAAIAILTLVITRIFSGQTSDKYKMAGFAVESVGHG